MNVRRYVAGKLVDAVVPAVLPPTPWRTELPELEQRDRPPPKPPRPRRRAAAPRADKWGLHAIKAVGESLTVPIGAEPYEIVARRVSVAISIRKHLWPERFTIRREGDRIRVTRTA